MTGANERLLDTIVINTVEAANYLANRGFFSCLCDETWIKHNSSPLEWIEYQNVRRDYIVEIINSLDPAEILLSDPGEYQWKVPAMEDRIRRRHELYGPVESLFSDRTKRHLIYLSTAQQRLSIVLERATPGAMLAFNERLKIFQELRELELDRHAAKIQEVKQDLGLCDDCSISSVFTKLFLQTAGGIQVLKDDDCERRISFLLDGSVVAIEANVDIDVSALCNGRFFVDCYVDGRFIHFSRALPLRFDPYKNYENESELAMCLLAWAEILAFAITRH